MKHIVFYFLLLVHCPIIFASEEIKTFIKQLSQEQKSSLEVFFQWQVRSANGFVLYGDKPIGLSSYSKWAGSAANSSKHSVMLVEGKNVLQDLKIDSANKEYITLIFGSKSYWNFICINRKSFIKTVNENISLFRYVLGPLLTPEGLLQQLIDAGDQFYDVLKNDNALLGILFGYGTQNALLVSRQELIDCDSIHDQNEEFPFISIKKRKENSTFPKMQLKRPSWGFVTISDEIDAIRSRLSLSHNNRPMIDPCQIPFFGCEIDSEETQALLATYKANQIEVIKAIEQEDLLEQVLTKLCTTTSGTIEIPSPPKERKLSLPDTQEDLTKKIAETIRVKVMLQEDRFEKNLLNAFLEGVVECETGKPDPLSPYYNYEGEIYSLETELAPNEKLQQANAYFSLLSKSQKGIDLIPNGVYFKILKKGKGLPVSMNLKNVSLHYSYRYLGKKKIVNVGTIKEEGVEHLIPGLLHALLGMKRGEERLISIHPRYAYGLDAVHTPNATIIAKVQLIDFQEGDQKMAIGSPYQLEMKNPKEILTKLEELKIAQYRTEGRRYWESLKTHSDLIPFSTFKKCMEEVMSTNYISFNSLEEIQQFGVDLQFRLNTFNEHK